MSGQHWEGAGEMGRGWRAGRMEVEETHVYTVWSSYKPNKHPLEGQTRLYDLTDVSLVLGSIMDPCLLFGALYRAYCLSCDFTG